MKIIGALKKACSASTVYFCKYSDKIGWKKVADFSTKYNTLSFEEREKIYVIVESRDDLENDKLIVGIAFYDRGKFLNIVLNKDYEYLNLYLKELEVV